MKNLFKFLTLAVVCLFLLPACSADDDFDEVVKTVELDTQATDDEYRHEPSPSGN